MGSGCKRGGEGGTEWEVGVERGVGKLGRLEGRVQNGRWV